MAITVYVNNIPFILPTSGEQPNWADNGLDGWHEEVTKVLNSLKGSNDILETGASISNNQVTPADVTDLKFDGTVVRSFVIEGNITRIADTTAKYEEFTLVGLREGTDWVLQQDGVGNSGVTFSITPVGQVQYTSINMTVVSTYSGLIKFKAISLLQS